jgi:hypothetical protein
LRFDAPPVSDSLLRDLERRRFDGRWLSRSLVEDELSDDDEPVDRERWRVREGERV